ncbi:MAG: acetylglutamate kinase [Alphaproteobacteria bacterium]|nr:acetylglutamate kinase [Alphaproteobacteria bacterium]
MEIKSLKTKELLLRTAKTVSEALPYIQRFGGKTFVIKYGGHAMGDERTAETFARDIVMLKTIGINPVVVHGGGPQIGAMLERLKIQSSFIDGLRVTDQATVEIVEMVLSGTINKQIVTAINQAGGTAIGLSGKDGELIKAQQLRRTKKDPDSNIEKLLDLGFVGEPTIVNPKVLENITASGMIPVIAPIGMGPNGETYNINADTAAGAIASALKADKLMMLTDVPGILTKDKQLISEINAKEIDALLADGTITGGMIPKVETCVDALKAGVNSAHILDGRIPHVLLIEVFTAGGASTMIKSA